MVLQSADHNSKIEEAKPKTWYHDAIAGANLPTSVISQQAMQAGMDFRPSGYEQQGSNKPKPRNGSKPADVPQRGFSVSLDMAERVVRMGGTDATGPALVEPPVGAFPPLATNAVAPHTGYTSSYISQPTNVIAQQSGMHPGYASYHYAPHPPNGAASQNRHLSSYTPPYQPTGVLQDDSSVRSVRLLPFSTIGAKLTFFRPSKTMTPSAHLTAQRSAPALS